jgi:hypothetical protein
MNDTTYSAEHSIPPFNDITTPRNVLGPPVSSMERDETMHIPVSVPSYKDIKSPGEVVAAAVEEQEGRKVHAEEVIADAREPKVNPFMMIPVVHVEALPILIAALAAAAQGVIPLVFYWILGNLIGSIATSSPATIW